MFKNFSINEAVWVLEAKLLSPQYTLKSQVTGICTDSRKIKKGNLFIALEGENYDGHDYVKDAIAKGACGAEGETKGRCTRDSCKHHGPSRWPGVV